MGFDAERQTVTLSEEECWGLLEGNDLGRLAVSVQDRPDIFPINYVVSGRKVILRTSEGSKLLEMTINSHVALEIDAIGERSAVSVVVHGLARQLKTDAEIEAVADLPLRARIGTITPVYVEITPTDVAGRRFLFGPEPQ